MSVFLLCLEDNEVVWTLLDVTPCSLVYIYQSFGKPASSIFCPEGGDSNVGAYLQDYTSSHLTPL
jgi:hypothetical protein